MPWYGRTYGGLRERIRRSTAGFFRSAVELRRGTVSGLRGGGMGEGGSDPGKGLLESTAVWKGSSVPWRKSWRSFFLGG